MQQDLANLIRLQDLMLRIDAMNEQIAAIPAEVARLEKDLLEAQKGVEQEKSALAELQKERRRLEGELMGVEAKIQKYQAQLMDVKTNKEYQAMQHEIEGCKAERASLDEKILLEMEEQEKGNTASRALEDRLKEMRRRTEDGKKALADKGAALKRDRDVIDADRQALQKEVSPVFLDPFLKTARQRRGIGLVGVRDGLCGGCHVRVLPKLIQEVRRSTHLIVCETCKRFLYVVDDVVASGPARSPGAPEGASEPARPETGGDGESPDPRVS
ncbi:MAG TPA: C4-type zinc ribbon domain-containing protein [Candidatus Polarisedimenticolia bacterium]|nr:C4-type zinc ribbon domain-containing protein [Candidatus Polarisedimenticolia bacterium]